MILAGLKRVKANAVINQQMVYCVPFDLADTSGIDRIVEQQIKTLGRIDYLTKYRRNKPEGKN